MIYVVNRKDNLHKGQPYKVYIGRPSVLGNPYIEKKHGRSECIRLFEQFLLSTQDRKFLLKMYELHKIHDASGCLVLECWCKPKACHGDVIKKYLMDTSYITKLTHMCRD